MKFTFDFRTRVLEQRTMREGNALHFEGRTNIINQDGSIEHGKWLRTGTIPNYGDCFDRKDSLLSRIIKPILGL